MDHRPTTLGIIYKGAHNGPRSSSRISYSIPKYSASWTASGGDHESEASSQKLSIHINIITSVGTCGRSRSKRKRRLRLTQSERHLVHSASNASSSAVEMSGVPARRGSRCSQTLAAVGVWYYARQNSGRWTCTAHTLDSVSSTICTASSKSVGILSIWLAAYTC